MGCAKVLVERHSDLIEERHVLNLNLLVLPQHLVLLVEPAPQNLQFGLLGLAVQLLENEVELPVHVHDLIADSLEQLPGRVGDLEIVGRFGHVESFPPILATMRSARTSRSTGAPPGGNAATTACAIAWT